MSDPVILVDAMNLVFRAHYSHRNLSCDGKPTSVLFGATQTLADLRERVSKRIVVCWDHGGPVDPGTKPPKNWRERFLPTYKETRKREAPSEDKIKALSQTRELAQIVEWLGYRNAAARGLEADDVIGILSADLARDGEVLIFSTDQDFYQLLGPKVSVLVPKKDPKKRGQFDRITVADVEKSVGIPVARFAEYLALGADKSDEIKPRRGMGPKTALKLIADGVDLKAKTFDELPVEFRQKHADLESIWSAIRASYRAARIPRSRKDPRIATVPGLESLSASPDQRWDDRRRAEESFVRFCADHEMVTLLALSSKLFDSGDRPPCSASRNQNRRIFPSRLGLWPKGI